MTFVLQAFFVLLLLLAMPATAADGKKDVFQMYKNPGCECCDGHAAYLREQGYEVVVTETPELDAMRAARKIPAEAAGCHFIVAGDYVIEGHVPAAAIKRLLVQKPDVDGITLPGMPMGSPGMGGKKDKPFIIYAFKDGKQTEFMRQ